MERFPLAGKWYRRFMIMFIFLLAAWSGLGSLSVWQFVFAIAAAVLGAVWALADLYSIVRGHGDYIELLPDGVLLTFGLPLWSLRMGYETVSSAEVTDRWSDRAARSLLRMIGRSNPPRVELRFRRRVFAWWAIWPRRGIYIRPTDPQAVVAALSARLGAA